MEKQLVIHNTFVIERSFPKKAKRVFAAFADPAVKQRWFVGDHKVEAFDADFRVGGDERVHYSMDAKSPIGAALIKNEGSYLVIVPDQRIVMASTMTVNDRQISAALLTIELVETASGTDLVCTHQAAFFEGADGPQMREAGWRQLFARLSEELAGP